MSTSLRDTLVRERYLLRFDWAMQDFPNGSPTNPHRVSIDARPKP